MFDSLIGEFMVWFIYFDDCVVSFVEVVCIVSGYFNVNFCNCNVVCDGCVFYM